MIITPAQAEQITHHKRQSSFYGLVILGLLIAIPIAYGIGRYTKQEVVLDTRAALITCQAELIDTKQDLKRALLTQTEYRKDYLQRKYLDIYAFEQVIEIENQR